MKLQIRNLRRFQHYRNRCPPWIKLHREILDNTSYAGLPSSAWRLGLELVLLASWSDDGATLETDIQDLSWRLRRNIDESDVEHLISAGFLVLASGSLALASNMLDRGEERRGETEERQSREEPENPPSPLAGGRVVSRNGFQPGFLQAWKAYPHQQARSRKSESSRRWKALKLERHLSNVLAHIEFARSTPDFTRDGGAYIPGFQVWIKGHDFTEPPPSSQPDDLESWAKGS